MSRDKTVTIYLDWRQRQELEQQRPGILMRVKRAFDAAGWQVIIAPQDQRHNAAEVAGHHLVVNRDIVGPFCLNLRNAYLGAFWRIEDTNDRWDFSVAKAIYDPATVPADRGQAFLQRWQPMVLKGVPPTREGFIFMPLQGVLQRQRHFQSMSPVEMIHATLEADPTRTIHATLHPNEAYSADDRTILRGIAAGNRRFVMSDTASHDLLCRCDYVVTQNSSMALTGFFAEKPAVLFARIDFHHLAHSVPDLGVDRAFASLAQPLPDFGRYLFWFMRLHAIAQFADEAEARIASRLRDLGWSL